MGKNKKSNIKKKKSAAASVTAAEGGLMVDPARVRFQHSKIRPFFSGCGRSVEGTLEEIRQGKISPSDLPPIQVIVGPTDEDGPWYFSLNNRRLWVLKRCREEGLLPNNQIFVRVRKPKSEQEALRYNLNSCALEAKIVAEKSRQRKQEEESKQEEELLEETEPVKEEMLDKNKTLSTRREAVKEKEESSSSDDDSSDDDSVGPVSNRFSALF
jgi:hypothetical protein